MSHKTPPHHPSRFLVSAEWLAEHCAKAVADERALREKAEAYRDEAKAREAVLVDVLKTRACSCSIPIDICSESGCTGWVRDLLISAPASTDPSVVSKDEENYRAIRQIIDGDEGKLSIPDIKRKLGCSLRAAERVMQRLLKDGIISWETDGRQRREILPHSEPTQTTAHLDREKSESIAAVVVEAWDRFMAMATYHRGNREWTIGEAALISFRDVVAYLHPRATAHLERVRTLEANQRTPGFAQMCPLSRERVPCFADSSSYPNDCAHPSSCPIKAAMTARRA